MMPAVFYQSVKSTLDYIGHQIAEAVKGQMPSLTDLGAFTLDAPTGYTEKLTSSDPAIVWSLNSFDPAPTDPLYTLSFLIGPKTTADVSAELMTVLIGVVHSTIPERSVFEIKNYSGPVVSEAPGETGTGFITSTSVQEQVFDNQAALRMIVVSVAVSRDLT